MRNGILVSDALHVGVIGAALIAWPQAFDLSAEPPPMLTVELVTVTDATTPAGARSYPVTPLGPVPQELVIAGGAEALVKRKRAAASSR